MPLKRRTAAMPTSAPATAHEMTVSLRRQYGLRCSSSSSREAGWCSCELATAPSVGDERCLLS
jgi:hypothetical protein